MNKYITTLLVVLAATGAEAQNYQSALRAVLGNSTFEEICHQPEFTGLETTIRSIIEAYRNIRKKDETEPAKDHTTICHTVDMTALPHSAADNTDIIDQDILPNPSIGSSISIRAPSLFCCQII